MSEIIIYGSQYGTTRMYAEELSKITKIQAISFEEIKDINKYDKIIYLGGLYAGGVLGMAKTFKKISNYGNKKIIIARVKWTNTERNEYRKWYEKTTFK